MTAAAPSAMLGAIRDPKLDADGCLLDELACRRCGYALRGLRPSGACPECETPIGKSIKGELLCYSDPDWVERIARGGRVLALSIVLFATLPIFAMLLSDLLPAMAIGIALATAKAVQVCGFWLATAPEPAMREREAMCSSRVIARCGSLITGAIWTTAFLTEARPSSLLLFPLPGAINQPVARAIVDSLVSAVGIGSSVALLLYARSLAFRLWDDKLWRQLRGVALVFLISYGTKTLFETYTTLTGAKAFASTDSPLQHIESLARVVTLITMLWCISLIARFRTLLNDAARLARETWSQPLLSSHPNLGAAHDE